MSIIPLVYTIEHGSGKDVYFGRQETYTAPSCASGDRTVSCVPETRKACSSYTRIFGCCDAVDGGACGISVGCTHCTDQPTGNNICTCEKTPPTAPPVQGTGPGSLLPIGTAGATVMQTEGEQKKPNVLAIVLLLAVIGGIIFVVMRARAKAA